MKNWFDGLRQAQSLCWDNATIALAFNLLWLIAVHKIPTDNISFNMRYYWISGTGLS